MYRELELIFFILSKFYFEIDFIWKDSEKLIWFGEKGVFKVLFGGDGVFFGKWDELMFCLVSFFNVGVRVVSLNDNFLLFGVNCKEDYFVVRLFIK